MPLSYKILSPNPSFKSPKLGKLGGGEEGIGSTFIYKYVKFALMMSTDIYL